jgi:hypothetical protein
MTPREEKAALDAARQAAWEKLWRLLLAPPTKPTETK